MINEYSTMESWMYIKLKSLYCVYRLVGIASVERNPQCRAGVLS